MLVESVGVRSGALNFVLLAEDYAGVVLLAASRRGQWLERETAGAAEANLVPGSAVTAISTDHWDASTVLPLVESAEGVLPMMMGAHATYVASAVLQNIHGSRRCNLVRACLLYLVSVTVAVGTVRHRLILDTQVHDLWEEAVLGAHRELLVVSEAILVLEVQLVRRL